MLSFEQNPEAQKLHAGPLRVKLLARMDPLKYLFEKPNSDDGDADVHKFDATLLPTRT